MCLLLVPALIWLLFRGQKGKGLGGLLMACPLPVYSLATLAIHSQWLVGLAPCCRCSDIGQD